MKLQVTQEQLDTPLAILEEYGLSVGTIGILEAANFLWIRDLENVTPEDLCRLPNFAEKRTRKLANALGRFLRGDEPELSRCGFQK